MELMEITLTGDINSQLKQHLPNSLCLGAITNRTKDYTEFQVLGRKGFPIEGWIQRPNKNAQTSPWFLKWYK